MTSFLQIIRRRLLKIRLKPIRVFVFHQVSESFDSSTMWECDWTQTDIFKRSILNLKKRFVFISLQDALQHIECDRLRRSDYAVLTADDGWESLKNIIPWLTNQNVPITLFVNPLYMDGIHKHSRETERYLTKEEVSDMMVRYAPFVSVASHGWSHADCSMMSLSQFKEHVDNAESYLAEFSNKIPFYAFSWGKYQGNQIEYLREKFIVPVFVDCQMNFNDPTCIHRECIDGKELVNE